MSLRTALSYFADVLSSPTKEALAALSSFASNKAEADRLLKMSTPEGKADYAEFVHKPHRSLMEVLRAFPSAKPTLGAFFGTIAPRLQPRFYSISSAPKPNATSVHITCALVRDTMPTGRIHEGVASTWLSRQKGLTTTKGEAEHRGGMRARLLARLVVSCDSVLLPMAAFRSAHLKAHRHAVMGKGSGKLICRVCP